jgi:histone H3/H4
VPSQSSDIPSIPRALLLRLMHEHFASKDTKIDKHALVVLEKYFEIYIREAIARSLLAKKEDVEKGAASQGEERWLEKSDLEKIVAGVVMDF